MDVVAPPAASADSTPVEPPQEEVSPEETPKEADTKKPAPTKPAKAPGNGVTLAIVATVFIVFGLAALAVLAYLNQPK